MFRLLILWSTITSSQVYGYESLHRQFSAKLFIDISGYEANNRNLKNNDLGLEIEVTLKLKNSSERAVCIPNVKIPGYGIDLDDRYSIYDENQDVPKYIGSSGYLTDQDTIRSPLMLVLMAEEEKSFSEWIHHHYEFEKNQSYDIKYYVSAYFCDELNVPVKLFREIPQNVFIESETLRFVLP